jgi:hypothetical protein
MPQGHSDSATHSNLATLRPGETCLQFMVVQAVLMRPCGATSVRETQQTLGVERWAA